MRNCLVFVIVLLGSRTVFAQTRQSSAKVDRPSGYLVTATQAGRDSLSKETISHSRRESAIDCCDVQDRLVEVRTKRVGRSEFTHISAGAYWIWRSILLRVRTLRSAAGICIRLKATEIPF